MSFNIFYLRKKNMNLVCWFFLRFHKFNFCSYSTLSKEIDIQVYVLIKIILENIIEFTCEGCKNKSKNFRVAGH